LAGFQIIYAFDSNEASIKTYRHNIGSHAHVEDVSVLSKKNIEETVGYSISNIDILFGGPPCQGFSVQRRGSDNDQRNDLVKEFVRLVLEVKPKFFLIENVGGLISVRGKPYYEELLRKCGEACYAISTKKLNAADFGVPQNRKRVFIVGELVENGFASFQFPEGERKYWSAPITVKDAIYDLMGKSENEMPNHISGNLSPINLSRIKSLKAGQGREFLPLELQLKCHIENPSHRHFDAYGRMAWNTPSPTITTKFDSFSRGKFGHPELDRNITLREGARLQSFPDSFIFWGNKSEIATQIGNAVPPILAKALGERIRECLLNLKNR
jgi:DNA (cytosine-5)-methyltransferase 1